jgi:hypothetical protein
MNLLKIITPTNLLQEKEKFFNDKLYHPQFKYNWNVDLLPESYKKNKLKADLIQSIFEQDYELITLNASRYFQTNLQEYQEVAKEIIKSVPRDKPIEKIDDFVLGFEKAFKYFNLDYTLEIVDTHGFNFRPNAKNKRILMSKHADFQFFTVIGEVKHELTHILRYENGKFNNIKKSIDYLPTEEGLATLMQDRSDTVSRFQHAAEYMASAIGQYGSLRHIYEYFISIGFNSELAWQRAARHKFGFIDTKAPGDIMKPAMYFYHSQILTNYSKNDILKLFSGKISTKITPELNSYKGIIPSDKIRVFFEI